MKLEQNCRRFGSQVPSLRCNRQLLDSLPRSNTVSLHNNKIRDPVTNGTLVGASCLRLLPSVVANRIGYWIPLLAVFVVLLRHICTIQNSRANSSNHTAALNNTYSTVVPIKDDFPPCCHNYSSFPMPIIRIANYAPMDAHQPCRGKLVS